MAVERDRRVAGDVLLRKGHMERDCLRRASIVKRVRCSMLNCLQLQWIMRDGIDNVSTVGEYYADCLGH